MKYRHVTFMIIMRSARLQTHLSFKDTRHNFRSRGVWTEKRRKMKENGLSFNLNSCDLYDSMIIKQDSAIDHTIWCLISCELFRLS